MVKISWPVPYAPTIEPSYSRLLELPPIVTCVQDFLVPPFIGDSLGNGYNCNRCRAEGLYFIPFERGDIIPLQTWLGDPNVNPDPLNPTKGFHTTTSGAVAGTDFYVEAELYDSDCVTVIFDEVNLFTTDYWVGFSPRVGPLQTLFVDTSKLPINQQFFRIKLTTYNPAGGVVREAWTEVFRELACDAFSVQINSSQAITDCDKREYLEPSVNYNALSPTPTPTPFYLGWRYGGELVQIGHQQQKELNDNERVLTNRVKKQFELQLLPIPVYIEDILAAQITGQTVLIDGEEYVDFGDIAKNLDKTRLFLPRVTCFQFCDLDSFFCD